jgi:O-succinylbenzoic acid--CoA ligase
VEKTRVIDFTSDETHLLLNPRMPAEERVRLERLAAAFPLRGHVWIATSGTSGAMKLAALSKQALLVSAAAVNRHLESTSGDVWCCVLPAFHVGGLGIHARAFLSGARVIESSWDPRAFAEREEVTLSALVPAQVSDLVRERLRAPRAMRAIVVGGGALDADLYREGRALGWPLLPSYGMTECCSQVATARGDSPALRLLSHVEVRTDAEGCLAVRSGALLSGYAVDDRFVDPKVNGWLQTEDIGEVRDGELIVRGRRGAFVKIGGESVDLSRLDAVLERAIAEAGGGDAAVVAIPDDRLGHVIQLVWADGDAAAIRAAFDAAVMPFERARAVHRVARIPRTALGKLRRAELVDELLRGDFEVRE